MNFSPLITVGIPTYNRPEGINAILERITNQTYSNLEIIVSDNCSTDSKVAPILEKWEKSDKRIRIYRQYNNNGLANNFQFVLSKAIGEYFMWVSDDDLIELNYIKETYDFIKDNPDYSLVMGRIALYTPELHFIKYTEKLNSIESENPQKRVYAYFKNIDVSGYFYGLYRTAFIQAIGYTNRMLGADILISIATVFSGKIKVLNTTSYIYILGGNSVDHERLAKVVGLSQFHAIFFGFHDTRIVAQTIMKHVLFSRLSYFQKLIFCFKCSLLMLKYTRAFHSSFIVIKRKIFRVVLGRNTLSKI